jgi:hypothetical protein
VIDVGLPLLHNTTDHAVRLRWVRLAEHVKGVHVLDVTAYQYSQVGQGVGAATGDLRKRCRKEMIPYPVTTVVTGGHKDSNWFIVIALTFSKPGRYHLGRAKIGYQINGATGWQYQYLSTTLTVHQTRHQAHVLWLPIAMRLPAGLTKVPGCPTATT